MRTRHLHIRSSTCGNTYGRGQKFLNLDYFNVICYVIEKLAFGPKKIYEMHVKFVFSDSTLSRLRTIFRCLTETFNVYQSTFVTNLDTVSFTAVAVTD